MKRPFLFLGILLIVAFVSGGAGSGFSMSRLYGDDYVEQGLSLAGMEIPSPLPPAILATRPASQPAPRSIPGTRLASMTPAHQRLPGQITRSRLMTLPEGGDLLAEINNADGPVLLDFFADWCGPCRTQGRILQEMEGAAAKSRTLMIKVNVDQHPQVARRLNVSSLPTLIMLKDGKVVERRIGLADKTKLADWME